MADGERPHPADPYGREVAITLVATCTRANLATNRAPQRQASGEGQYSGDHLVSDGAEHDAAQGLLRERYAQLSAMNIQSCPVIAVRIDRTILGQT
jgi:hypothetical protein